MIWKQALVLPDTLRGWHLAESRILGIPALARLLLVLKRSGIQEVILPAEACGELLSCVEPYQRSGGLPILTPLDPGQQPAFAENAPFLVIRWSSLLAVDTLTWLSARCGELSGRGSCLGLRSSRPVLGSFFPEHGLVESLMERGLPTVEETMEPDGTCGGGCAFVVPDNLFLAEVEELASGEGDRKLLQTVGKPTDRWHVVWIRNRTFGVMRWLAARAVTPNQISVAGFFVAVLACVVIASGGYLRGVAGAVLLYASWVLDCMDGTLARLTFAESTFGRKLDTILGHLANLSTFGALIWAAYGEQSPLEAVFFGFLILGGILVAHRLSEEDKRTRPAKVSATDSPRLTAFLDKINHRDYAVIVLVLALADGFKIFVWLSAIGVQVFWLTELWLILARSGAAPASKSTPSRLFP